MRKDLMNILACPVCKGNLTLTADLEAEEDVIEGTLKCQHCSVDYPIVGSVPNFVIEDPIAE
ncbi:MAG: methytransferase partner Trm112 [Chloroflexota bacterium]|nr:methytransferase partner Trm112 [Chloroflexota bacterium]